MIVVAVFLGAAAVGTVELDDVLLAIDRHPAVISAGADVDAADAEAFVAEGAFDPLLRARGVGDGPTYTSLVADVGVDVPTTLWGATVSGGWRVGAGDVPIYEGKSKTNDGGELRLGLSLPLLRDGPTDRRRTTVARTALEQRVQRQARRQVRLDVARAAAFTYWEWVAAGARLAVAVDLERLALERDQQLVERARAGDVPAIDVDDNRRIVAQRRARTIAAERALQKTALELALFLRSEDGTPVTLTAASLPSLTASPSSTAASTSPATLLEDARALRPEPRRWRLVQAQLDAELALADNQLLPGLSLFAGVSQDIGPTSPPLSSSSTVWAPDPKTRALPDVDVGLVFELPIPLTQARGRRAAVEAARNRAAAQARLVDDRLALEVNDALSAAAAAAARLAAAEAEVSAAATAEAGEVDRYVAGDSTLFLVNQREQQTAEARLNLIEATADARRAEVASSAAAGRLLPPEDDDLSG